MVVVGNPEFVNGTEQPFVYNSIFLTDLELKWDHFPTAIFYYC